MSEPEIGWCPVCCAPRHDIGIGSCCVCSNHLMTIRDPYKDLNEIDALKAENAKMRVLLTRWKIYGEAMMKSGSQLPHHLIADSEEALTQGEQDG